MLVAAAEPVGDPVLVWRAAERLGIGIQAAGNTDGLLAVGSRVVFRHPLVRSAVYRAASPEERQAVHRALADATDPEVDPDRRAWHLAQATPGFDEDVAAELERSAGRAQARGGLAAAAAFLERAAALTLEPARRADRAFAAARANHLAGAPDAALGLLGIAESGPPRRAPARPGRPPTRTDRVRRQPRPRRPAAAAEGRQTIRITRRQTRTRHLPGRVVGSVDVRRSWATAVSVVEVARAARDAPPAPEPPRAADLLLDGLAVLITEGHAAGTPMLKRAVSAFRGDDISRDEGLRWLWVACHIAIDLWDDESWEALCTRHLQLARDAGALTVLLLGLNQRIGLHEHAGELAAAGSLVEEARAVAEATGSLFAPIPSPDRRRPAGPRGRPLRADRRQHERDGGPRRGSRTGHHPLVERAALQRPRPIRGGAGRGAAGQRIPA